MPVSHSIEITRAGEWIKVDLDKGTWNIYPENFNSILYLSIDANGTNPVLIDDNTHDFTFDQATSVYLKADNIVSPLTVYYNNFSIKVSKATPVTPHSDSIVLTNVWKQVTFDKGTWNIYTDNSRNIIQVSLDQTGSNPVSISGDKRQFYFESQTNVYMRIQTVDPDLKVLVYYNNYSVISIEGGGSGSGPSSYTFSAPLNESNGNVSLGIKNDLKVETGNLTLDLNNNTDFQNLETSVTQNTQSISTLDGQAVKLTGDQSIAGNKVFTSKLEIDANDEVLKLKNTSNTPNYIAGYEGDIRIYYIGKDASNSIDLSIKNEYSVNGWITLKTKSKFDQEYTITDNAQIVHKKYVDDTINTNCVKLTGNQTIAGNKTISGFSKFINFVDMDLAPSTTYPFMMRFVGDKWPDGQSADLIRFHKYGPACGYKVYLNGTYFNYAEIYGLTLISNMKDPTENAHGANKRYVDNAINNNALPKATTNAINTIQVSNSASKYFNFDYVLDGTGYRNWSGIQLRAKRNPGDFETMWKVEYRDQNNLGLFMTCIGNKLNFDSDTKIIGVSCEDSDGEKTAASKKYVDDKINTEISQIKSKIKEIVAQSTDFNDFKTKIQNW